MVDFFDKLYTGIAEREGLLARLRFHSVLRTLVRWSANLVLPLHFRLTSGNPSARLPASNVGTGKIVVTLTSIPLRIEKLWIVVESLLRQTTKPDKIVLWLSRDQFGSIDRLPSRLLRQQERGLTIELRDGDLRSHKKYFYAVQEFPEDTIITVDDDIIYRSTLLAELLALHATHPAAVCCHLGLRIRRAGDRVLKYVEWLPLTRKSGPAADIFPTSGAGTLYPPHSLHESVTNRVAFMNTAMNADDVWLYCMARLQGTEFVKTDETSACLPVLYASNESLFTHNVGMRGNDEQLAAVRRFCQETFGVDVCDPGSPVMRADL